MRITRNSIAAALALALAACGGTENRGVESVHQPVVHRTDYVLDVGAGSGSGLASGEQAHVEAWFDSLRVGYGDQIAVVDASGDRATRNAIAAVAARRGLMLVEAPPVTEGEVAPGSVRVIVSRMAADVPGCPDWSRKSQPEFDGNAMSNFGCGVNANLAAMVANPADLVRGQAGTGPTDTGTSTKAIKTYRETPSTGKNGLKVESSKGGN